MSDLKVLLDRKDTFPSERQEPEKGEKGDKGETGPRGPSGADVSSNSFSKPKGLLVKHSKYQYAINLIDLMTAE